MGRQERRAERNLVRTGPRAASGLHRCSGRGGPCRDAGRDRAPRRRPQPREPAPAGRTGDRSLGAGRLLRPEGRVRVERGARVLAQQGTVRVPPVGAERIPELPRRASRYRHRSPGESRVPRARRRDGRYARWHGGCPRHGRGHRFAYDDGERLGRSGMGRRWHRGRSGDARSAHLDAHPAGARRPFARKAGRGRHGDRSGADDHRTPAQARRGREVRGVLRLRAGTPHAGRPCHAREHVPGVRCHDRHFPHRCHDARLLAPHRS